MADLSRSESFQYPAAHYGHLTDHQQAQLDAFKQLCHEQGYYTPADPANNVDASHDDETMLYVSHVSRGLEDHPESLYA
jgi:hypothetical protein